MAVETSFELQAPAPNLIKVAASKTVARVNGSAPAHAHPKQFGDGFQFLASRLLADGFGKDGRRITENLDFSK